MLRVLILLLIGVFNLLETAAYAKELDQDQADWAKDIAQSDQKAAIDNFKEMMNIPGFDQDLRESLLKPRPNLQIFVSSSMNKQLLKAYAKEAARYGGVLVFRGLPGGSFRKLSELVMSLSTDSIRQHPCAMQIDDEAFTGFGIKVVPTIVLSKPIAMFSDQVVSSNFDKVAGNITIKAALEIFVKEGELATNARELLK